jgi:hypothetical protein
MNYWGVVALLGSLAACNPDKGETETGTGGSDATAGSSGSMPTTGSSGEATTMDATGTDATGTDATGTPTTGDPTTGGASGECSPRLQDCPEGLKCTAYLKPPGIGWNANKCVQEPVNGGVAGDDCTAQDVDLFSGIDDCAKGFICQNYDMEGKNGVCIEFCQDDDSCPNTGGGNAICLPANEGVLPICLANCDPLVQDCAGSQGCYGDPSGPPFFCYGADPKDGGTDGSKCEFTNACLPGLNCSDAATLDGCDSAYCCTPFCPLDGMACTAPEECVPYYAEPVPGSENVGVCALPG